MLDFVRANELFAILPVTEAAGTDALVWVDGDSHRRALHGAEVTGLLLKVRPDLAVSAELTLAGPKLGSGASVSLDIRSWDAAGKPAIASMTIARGADPIGALVEGDRLRALPVSVRTLGPGRMAVNGLTIPAGARRYPAWFVTCWGSVRDKVTDPAVVARVVPAQHVTPRAAPGVAHPGTASRP